jgi:hypothetical protein
MKAEEFLKDNCFPEDWNRLEENLNDFIDNKSIYNLTKLDINSSFKYFSASSIESYFFISCLLTGSTGSSSLLLSSFLI